MQRRVRFLLHPIQLLYLPRRRCIGGFFVVAETHEARKPQRKPCCMNRAPGQFVRGYLDDDFRLYPGVRSEIFWDIIAIRLIFYRIFTALLPQLPPLLVRKARADFGDSQKFRIPDLFIVQHADYSLFAVRYSHG